MGFNSAFKGLRWPQEWPKHVGGRYIIKLHSYNQSTFFGLKKIVCIKNTDVVDAMTSKVLRDLRISLNQALKSADDYYIWILNVLLLFRYDLTTPAICLGYSEVCSFNCTRNFHVDFENIASNPVVLFPCTVIGGQGFRKPRNNFVWKARCPEIEIVASRKSIQTPFPLTPIEEVVMSIILVVITGN